jgi:hypothetical protein
MKVDFAMRSTAEMQARLASLQEAAGAEAQETCASASAIAQRLVFNGWILDTRVTAIMLCMICVFIYVK